MEEILYALKVDQADNIAVAIKNLKPGDIIKVQPDMEEIEVKKPIPFGHKIALRKVKQGAQILKYGECMGIATKDILIGEHVHISNVRSLNDEDKGGWE